MLKHLIEPVTVLFVAFLFFVIVNGKQNINKKQICFIFGIRYIFLFWFTKKDAIGEDFKFVCPPIKQSKKEVSCKFTTKCDFDDDKKCQIRGDDKSMCCPSACDDFDYRCQSKLNKSYFLSRQSSRNCLYQFFLFLF